MNTIGDIARKDHSNAWRWIALLGSLVTYAGMIAYSAVHNWSLLTRGIDESARLWAGIGVIALEITALALPLALHYWTHDAKQRIWTFTFYAIDLFLVTFNVIIDYSLRVNTVLPTWLETYLFYLVPATPIICGLGWSVIWLLDPGQRERAMIETMRVATRAVLAERIMENARDAQLTEFTDSIAATMASDIIRQTLGDAVRMTSPTNTIDRTWMQPAPAAPSNNGHKKEPITFDVETEQATLPNE
jgi:hypothetical protein